MTRDDFPYSLQPYAVSGTGGAGQDGVRWSVSLYRVADERERIWLRDNGFTLRGRTWKQAAPPAGADPGL